MDDTVRFCLFIKNTKNKNKSKLFTEQTMKIDDNKIL